MSKFDNPEKQPDESMQYEDIEMSLQCGQCGERSSNARQQVGTGLIGWKCPNGHKNLLEGFNFG